MRFFAEELGAVGRGGVLKGIWYVANLNNPVFIHLVNNKNSGCNFNFFTGNGNVVHQVDEISAERFCEAFALQLQVDLFAQLVQGYVSRNEDFTVFLPFDLFFAGQFMLVVNIAEEIGRAHV